MKKGTSLYLDIVRFGTALAVVAEDFGERTRHLFDAKLIGWLGSLTFALYLFHAPLLTFFTVYSLRDRASPPQALYMLVEPYSLSRR